MEIYAKNKSLRLPFCRSMKWDVRGQLSHIPGQNPYFPEGKMIEEHLPVCLFHDFSIQEQNDEGTQMLEISDAKIQQLSLLPTKVKVRPMEAKNQGEDHVSEEDLSCMVQRCWRPWRGNCKGFT